MTQDADARGEQLAQILAALGGYLPHLVVAGGWVPFIYARYLLPDAPAPLMTTDMDLVVPRKLPLVDGLRLDQRLTGSGCRMRLSGLLHPRPLIRPELPTDHGEVELEFLVDGLDATPVEFQAGLTAQALHYMRVLLDNSEPVQIVEPPETGAILDASVRVASPAAFVFQKGLTFTKRPHHPRGGEFKRAKDLYYIYDVLDHYRPLHPQMYSDLARFRSDYPSSWFRTFVRNLAGQYGSVGDAGVRLVVSQRSTAHAELSDDQFAQRVYGVMKLFLQRLDERGD